MSFRTNRANGLTWSGEPWSKSLAYAAFNELIDAHSFVPFITSIVGNAEPCLVVPEIDAEGRSVTVYALYGPKKRLGTDALASPDIDELAGNWHLYAKAIVIASYDEGALAPFQCVGHSGSTRAVRALNIKHRLGLPRYDEFLDGMSRYLHRYREDRGISHGHPTVDFALVREFQKQS